MLPAWDVQTTPDGARLTFDGKPVEDFPSIYGAWVARQFATTANAMLAATLAKPRTVQS